MTNVQALGTQALRDKSLPQPAKYYAETLTRLGPGHSPATITQAISFFLRRTANWKGATAKEVKRGLTKIREELQ